MKPTHFKRQSFLSFVASVFEVSVMKQLCAFIVVILAVAVGCSHAPSTVANPSSLTSQIIHPHVVQSSPPGTWVEFQIPTSSSVPLGIAAGPGKALWFAESSGNAVGKITAAGAVTEYHSFSQPQYLVDGPDGAMWVTVNGAIGRITANGHAKTYAIPYGGADPLGI